MKLSVLNRLNKAGYYAYHRSFESGEFYPEHNHAFYEFLLVTSGTLRQTLNGRRADINSGCLQFLLPTDTHRVGCFSTDARVTLYNFHVSRQELMRDYGFITEGMRLHIGDCVRQTAPLPDGELARLCGLFERVHTPVPETPRIRGIFRLLTLELLEKLIGRTHCDNECDEPPAWLNEVCAEMHKLENFRCGLNRMKELAGCSVEHLCRMMRRYFGMTPNEFILELRLQQAAQQLEAGCGITEAAFGCGFSNLSYFRRCFRKYYALSPREFRAGLRRE